MQFLCLTIIGNWRIEKNAYHSIILFFCPRTDVQMPHCTEEKENVRDRERELKATD